MCAITRSNNAYCIRHGNLNAYKLSHLLDKKVLEALEQTFNIELHPEEFEVEEDPLLPDYGQMDLDLLDERVDEEMESLPISSESDDEPL